MAREYATYAFTAFVGPTLRPYVDSRQAGLIVAALSRTAAIKAMAAVAEDSPSWIRNRISETSHQRQVSVAMSSPGTVFVEVNRNSPTDSEYIPVAGA